MSKLGLAVLAAALVCGACQKSAPQAPPVEDQRGAKPIAERPAVEPPSGDDDYARMRFELAATEGFNAYGVQLVEKVLIDQAMAAWQQGDLEGTLESFHQVLEAYPTSIETHRRLADTYEILIEEVADPLVRGELEKIERKHRAMADGLVKSITDSGDGRTPETAFKVITISEEYMTMFYLGLEVRGQALVDAGGVSYDLLMAVDEGGNEHQVYFDISSFHK